MNDIFSITEKIVKVSACLSLLLLAFGAFDTYEYYKHFNIQILAYINPSELIPITISSSGYVFISLIIQIVVWYLTFNNHFKKMLLGPTKILPNNRKWHLIAFALLISLFIPIMNAIPDSSNKLRFPLFTFVFCVVLLICCFLLSPVIYQILRLEIKVSNPTLWTGIIVFSVNTLFMLSSKNSILFTTVHLHGNRYKVNVVINNKDTISQNLTMKYIGRSNDYFFYWDSYTPKTFVIPASQVTKVIIDY